MVNNIKPHTIQLIMDRAMEISNQCNDLCRNFEIMVSPMHSNTLILRWITINIEDVDRPIQCYRYECFNLDGSPQLCSINYSNVEEANLFFNTLENLYKQDFAIDHKL